jgi:hypothetical protein
MKEKTMKKFTIILIGILTLLSCSNPFVNSILPDKNGNKTPVIVTPPEEPEPPVDPSDPDAITIRIVLSGNVTGDSVTAAPVIAKDGDEITLNYTVAGTKLNNRLVFSGTNAVIEQVDGAQSGSRKYTVDEEDSTEGVITIHAVFSHSDKEFDDIAFKDRENESVVYGSEAFAKPITDTGKGSGAISYKSSDPTVATVDAAGLVTILKVGTTDITATKAADDIYEKAEAVYTLTVTHLQLTIAVPVITTTKTYDGLATAEITSVGELDNIVGEDDVTLTAAANFASKNAGNRQITVVYTIGGEDAINYIKPVDYTIAGTINKLQLAVTESLTTSKPYDGNTNAAVSISSSNKISTDTLTITPAGTYNAATVTGANLITVSYTISGADAGNYIKPADYSVAGTITKTAGSAVSVPKTASKTDNSITVRSVTMQSPNLGQTAEYATGTTSSAPTIPWQDGHTFSGLTKDSTLYIFARSKADDNCDAGTQQVSAAIKVMDDSYRNTVIDFETAISGITFTRGDNDPTVTVVADPANTSQKSLRITTSGNGWNQAAVIPVYLPYALSNYDSFSFRFRLLNVGSDTTPRSIQVYAAANTSTFVRYAFGNSSGTNFAANLVGSTPAVLFNDSYINTWTEYEITCSPGSTISNLQGNIFIAIGMNCNDVRDYLLDDLTFLMKDSFDPPPFITPASATFDRNAQSDIPVTVAFQSKTLTSITKSGTALNSGSDYTVSGNTVTLKTSYLNNLPDGSTPLIFTFNNGATCTFTINVGLLLNYDFSKIADGPVSGIGYSSSNISATVTGGILRVSKTNTNHTTENFILSFNVGTGNLSNYSAFKISIKGVSGDYTNAKDVRAWVGSTELGSKQSFLTTSFQDVLVPITYASANTYTGEVRVGIGLYNTQAVTYEITSIELVPK